MGLLSRRLAIISTIGSWWAANAVRRAAADGDDFFNADTTNGIPLDQQLRYVGSVKDDAGVRVADAVITITIHVPPEYGGQQLKFESYTNMIGRYRSLNLPSVMFSMLGLELDVEPSQVEIAAGKKGYATLRTLRRSKTSQRRGAIETDFVLAKLP